MQMGHGAWTLSAWIMSLQGAECIQVRRLEMARVMNQLLHHQLGRDGTCVLLDWF